MLAKSFVCSYLRCSYLRQQVERLVRSKPKDPRSGDVATVWFVRSQKIHVLATVWTFDSFEAKRSTLWRA